MGSASSVLTKVSKGNTSVPFAPLLRNRVTVQNGRVCGDTHSMLDVLGASRALCTLSPHLRMPLLWERMSMAR